MRNIRIIPRLEIKGPHVVKGIHLEGLRIVGEPVEMAKRYYEDGADEILYVDIVASLYQRNHLSDIVRKASERIFIPLTVGGGIRTCEDIADLLRSGADKVVINTAAILQPDFVNKAAKVFGSQCIVVMIEAKQTGQEKWEAYYNSGREKSGWDVKEWAQRLEAMGAGEILITSIDKEGTGRGLDLDLIKAISDQVSIPLIAHGGVGSENHVYDAVMRGHADAIAMSSLLHYGRSSIEKIKNYLRDQFAGDSTERVLIP